MIKAKNISTLLTDCTTATVHRTHVRTYGCALTKHQCRVMYLHVSESIAVNLQMILFFNTIIISADTSV